MRRAGLIWQYNVREVVDQEDARLQRGHYFDKANWHGKQYHLLVGTFYAQYLFGVTETLLERASQVGGRVRLNENDQKEYDKKRQEIRQRFAKISKDCLALLTKAGLTVDSVIDAVNIQNAYDGSKSTVSVFDAGGIDESGWVSGAREDLKNLERKETMSAYFARKDRVRARTMMHPNGLFSMTVAGRSDVYFRTEGTFWNGEPNGFNNQTTILHEALHSLTGLGDEKLYTLLTGKTATHDAASAGISDALKGAGCSK